MHLMKKISNKIFVILLCILFTTTFSGCNNSKYTDGYDASDTSIQTTISKFDNNQGQFYMQNGSAAAENGYYYITTNSYYSNNTAPSHNYFIYYYDMTSQTTVPLCSKLECKHNDSDCDACITANKCLGQMIWYYNGRLFMIERTDENDNLVSYDKEGRNKEKVCILSDTDSAVGFKDSVDNVACVNAGYLFYETYNSTSDSVDLKKVELKSNATPQEIGKISINPNTSSSMAFRFYPFQDNIYIFQNQYVSSTDITYSIYKYDVNVNDLSSVVEFKYGDSSNPYRGYIYGWNSNMIVDNDGNIYYISLLDGEKLPETAGQGYNHTCILNQYNLSTRKNKELYVLEGTSDKICSLSSLNLNGYDGTYIYFYEFQTPPTFKMKSNLIEDCNNLIVMNTSGTIVDKIHFTINSEFLDKYYKKGWGKGSIRINKIIPGDDRYIMLVTTENAIQGLERSDEYMKNCTSSSNYTETEVLAVFDKKQIGTGTHTWIKVKE